MFSERINRALVKSAYSHRNQKRKGLGGKIPYIIHPVAAALILLKYKIQDEDILISAILHDTIEDTEYTFKQLEEDFGSKVKDIVAGVTEEREEGLSWEERKKRYHDNLKKAPLESVWVAAADQVHNLASTIYDMENEIEIWREYDKKYGYKGVYKTRVEKLNIIKERIGDHPIIDEYEDLLAKEKELRYED